MVYIRQKILRCKDRVLDLDRPRIMGILNVTPDSFSDGGELWSGKLRVDELKHRALDMRSAGADILDIGGESTRPQAQPVSEQEEMDRVLSALEIVRDQCDAIVSVDTSKPAVMRGAVEAGAQMINDVRALSLGDALSVAMRSGCAVCLMHMQGEPQTMQEAPDYPDGVIPTINAYLSERVSACRNEGISDDRLLLDPGFGFGKSLQHNLEILSGFGELSCEQLPWMVGLSRKSMLEASGRGVRERTAAGVAAAVLAVESGAVLVRTHDVGATRSALSRLNALDDSRKESS